MDCGALHEGLQEYLQQGPTMAGLHVLSRDHAAGASTDDPGLCCSLPGPVRSPSCTLASATCMPANALTPCILDTVSRIQLASWVSGAPSQPGLWTKTGSGTHMLPAKALPGENIHKDGPPASDGAAQPPPVHFVVIGWIRQHTQASTSGPAHSQCQQRPCLAGSMHADGPPA